MTAREISVLKANMPLSEPNGISASDMHDLVDTLDERTTQGISVKTANYTAALTDNRSKISFNSATPVTFSLPSTIPSGWECIVFQTGAGQVTVSAAQGNVFVRGSSPLTAGLYAMVYLLCVSNSGSFPQFVLTGDVGPQQISPSSNFSSDFSNDFF
jgi:hypothetical protein